MLSKLDPHTAAALTAERSQRFEAEARSARETDLAVGGRRSALTRSRLVATAFLATMAIVKRLRAWELARPRPWSAHA
jgi:hypothetical protein